LDRRALGRDPGIFLRGSVGGSGSISPGEHHGFLGRAADLGYMF